MDINTKMNLIKSVVDGDGDFKKSYEIFNNLQLTNTKKEFVHGKDISEIIKNNS